VAVQPSPVPRTESRLSCLFVIERERRRHERYEILAQVRVQRGAVDYVLELGNLSVSGALVSLGSLRKPTWVQLGRIAEFAIINPETLDPVTVPGRIVRVAQDEAGWSFAVEFVEPDAAAQKEILKLVVLAARGHQGPPPLPNP